MLIARLIDYILTKRGQIPPRREGDEGKIYTFEKGSKLPNALMVLGLVLGWGISATTFGSVVSYISGAIGTVVFVIGYFLKRKSVVMQEY